MSDKTLPSVYAVTGTIQPSNFAFWQVHSDELDTIFQNAKSLRDIRSAKGVSEVVLSKNNGYLGTISNHIIPKEWDAQVAGDKNSPRNPNLGARDVAALSFDNDTVIVTGTIKFVPNFYTPNISDVKAFTAVHEEFVKHFIDTHGLTDLVKAYIGNIYNGRILWRNQYGVRRETFIRTQTQSTTQVHTTEDSVVAAVAAALQAKEVIILEVAVAIVVGEGSEVFPSQPFADNKAELRGENYGRMLSSVKQNGKDQVILHSQKVGNALRTIDTWYAEDAETPIAVEAYGVVTTRREVHRPRNKNSFFNFFDYDVIKNTANKNDALYVMAMLFKGGVLGQKGE